MEKQKLENLKNKTNNKKKIDPKITSFFITTGLVVLLLLMLYLYFNHYFLGGRIKSYVEKKELISILFIGLDDTDTHEKADTLLLGLFNPDTKRFGIIALPRDLKVEIEQKTGLKAIKINKIYKKHGSKKLLKIVNQLTGIKPNFYMSINLKSLIKIIDLIGGVEIYVDKHMKYLDKAGGLYIDLPKGVINCDGLKAMQFIRYRNDERGDIGRIERQYEFILNLMKKIVIKKDVLTNIKLLRIIYKYVKTSLNFQDILNLLKYTSSADFHNIEMIKVPGKFVNLYGKEYVEPNIAKSKKLTSAFLNKLNYTKTDIIPQEIKVQVLNGSGKGGVARIIRDKLVRNRYNVIEFGNADSQNYEETLILDRSGNMKKAIKVSSLLKCNNVFPKINKFILIDVTIIVGKDYKKYF